MSLKIYLLGQFNLQANHHSLELPSRPAQSLLAYLALNAGVTIRREKLASLLWPEAAEPNARKYLRQTLWRIHKTLADASLAWEDYLQISDIEVTFNQYANYWLDADLLLTQEIGRQVEDLIEVVNFYQGELLPGFYDQWVILERERLQAAYHHKMSQLLEGLLQVGQWHDALHWAEQWILLGYSPEPAFRALMIAHAGLGDQGMVSAAYQRCVVALNRDLGLDPSPDTRKLFEQIVSGAPLPTILGIPEPETITIPEQNPAPGPAPYKGLDIFDTQDADLFFGREKLTAQLAGRLQEGEQLLFVVGASGSGKSSLVRAGLVPALTRGKPVMDGSSPPGISPTWLVHVIQPTSQPLESLASALCQDEPSLRSMTTLIDDLRHDPRSMHLCARRLCQEKTAEHLLLVVDQFEELFTLCQDEDQRSAFIANLLTAVDPQVSGPIHVVVTLRADFYSQCAQYPDLRQQLALHQEYIGPMNSEELRMAVEEPARRNNWDFEPGLVDLILREVRGQPGSLPLLSHALLETWHRRLGRIMTLKSYAEAGSVHGAIAHTAETVYQQELDEAQQFIARHIFLRLTDLGEDTPETRRRVQLPELLPSADQRSQVEVVLDKLVAARLVIVSQDYVEVSHEALIREWPTLRSWLEADREGVRLHHQLAEAALAWEAMDQDESALYRGARLAAALEWAQDHGDQVNLLEQTFLQASQDLVERRQQEQARANRWRRWLATGLAGILLVAILSTAFAFYQRNRAENEAHLATSRRLAAAAINNLSMDPQLSSLLALEAVAEVQDASLPVPREAEEALHQSLQAASLLEMLINAHRGGITSIDFSPDGERLVSVGKDRTLKVWDSGSGELLKSILASYVDLTKVAFSPDGDHIAAGDHDRTAKIWDSHSLNQLSTLEGHESGVIELAFSPEGDRLVTSSTLGFQGQIVWDLPSGLQIGNFFGHTGTVADIDFRPDGKQIATASIDGSVRLWDANTFEQLSVLNEGQLMMFAVEYNPDGTLLAASGEAGKVTIWDVESGDVLQTFHAHADWMLDIEFSPDGSWLATSSLDGTAKIWEISTGQELLQLSGHTDGIVSLAFHPEGGRLATASQDGTIRIWNVSLSREYLSFPTGGGSGRIAFSPDGSLLAAGTGREEEVQGGKVLIGEVHVWNLESGDEPVKFSGGNHQGGVEAVVFSPDGSRLASVGSDDSLKVWSRSNGKLIANTGELGLTFIHDVVYTPDGNLLIVGGESYSLEYFDASTITKLDDFTVNSAVDGLAISPDGQLCAVTNRSGYVILIDRSGNTIQTLYASTDEILDITFNSAGDKLALASADSKVSIWQLGQDQPQLILRGHSAPVMGVDFSPDGSLIATASQDGTARLWDATSGEELLLLKAEGDFGLVDVAFSPDGKMLATSGDDAVRVYLLGIEELTSLAMARLARGFTPEECARYLPEARCENLVQVKSAPESMPENAAGRICLETDGYGIYKQSFEYAAYLGTIEAAGNHGWEGWTFVPDAYEPFSQNLARALDSNCDLIIASAGFAYEGVVYDYGHQFPDQRFLLLDAHFDPPLENVWTVTYAVDQGAFQAGYLAAAMTQSGVIGTFGGVDTPLVTDFMIGFQSGMDYYNQKNGTHVKLLGWDTALHEGYFLNSFSNMDLAAQYTLELIEQGADIIFPVAGTGPGSAAMQVVMEQGHVYLIGVDQDYTALCLECADHVLTSVLKRLDQSVLRAADAIAAGTFKGGSYFGTLETDEVDLAPFHELETLIPEQIKADLEQIRADIIAGKILIKLENPSNP